MVYPVMIIKARYGGIYEGGEWLAFNRYDIPDAAMSDDIACSTYFATTTDPIGKGSDPQDAYFRLCEILDVLP